MDIFGAQLAEMRKQNEQKKQDSPRAAKQDTTQAMSQRSTGDPYGDQLAALRKEQAAKQRPQSLNAADALADVAGRITKAAADKKGTDLNKQRSSLMNQLKAVQDSNDWITDPDAANANKAEERRIINQLNVLDKAQGNADRYYSNADRAAGVLRSWGYRTAGSYLSTAAFGGQLAEAQDETGRAIADSAYAGYATDPVAIENMRRAVEQNGAPESIGVFKTNREMLAKADELLSRGERESAKVYEGAGKADRILADLATGALDLGADSLASAILPGSGLFAMGARTFGQGTYEQRKEGGSLGKQFLNGAKSAAIEILTEKIGGPFEKIYGKSMTGKAVNAFVSRFDNPIVQRGLSILSGAFSEGVEEFLSDFLNPVADRLLQLDDGTGKIFKEGWLQNALYDALIGGILGALGEGVKVAPGQRNAPSIEAAKDNAVRGALEAVDRAVQEQAQDETAEAAQKAAEAPTMPQGAEIPESTAEAPTAAPVELNSQERADRAAAPVETATKANEADLRKDPRTQQLLNIYISNIVNSARKNGVSLSQYYNATQGMNGFSVSSSDAQTIVNELAPVVQQLAAKGDAQAERYLNAIREKAGVSQTQPTKTVTPAPVKAEEPGSTDPRAAERETAILEEMRLESGLSREAAERMVDDRYRSTGEYDINKILSRPSGAATTAPSQQNIDNTAPADYTKTEGNGGITNEQGRSNAETGAGVAPGEGRLGAQYQSGDGSGRSPESAGIVRVDPELQKAYEKSGVVDYGLQDSSGASTAYSVALEEGRNSDPEHGWMVTPQTAEDLQGKKSFLAPDRSEGVVVTTDGDIEGVFKNKSNGKPGALMRLLPQAVASGGTKLDCYGEGLVFNYAPYGFIPVARVEFNEKYANPGWDPSKGRPYVYVMMHDGSSPAQMVENKTNKNYHKWTMEELKALPTYDKDGYDDAVAYRNSLMEQRKAADQQAADERYNELGERYGTIEAGENPARESAAPKQIDERRKVGEAVRTMYEASATPEERLADIRNAVVDGKLSYIPVSNESLANEAESRIRKDGWEASLRDFLADVRSGKTGDRLTALGAVLYNNAANSGMDGKSLVDLVVAYNDLMHNMGRGLAAGRILKTLTPEAKLYAIQKTVSRMNEEAAEKRAKKEAKEQKKRGKQANGKEGTEPKPKYHDKRGNIPVSMWAARAGETVADSMAKKLEEAGLQKPAKIKTVAQQAEADIKKVLSSYSDTKSMNISAEALENILNNPRFALDLYENLRNSLEQKSGLTREEIESLGMDWINEPLADVLGQMAAKDKNIHIDEKLADEFLKAETDEERDKALDRIKQNIADQIPSTIRDKWNALRYLNMLGNFKTQIRNLTGNATMLTTASLIKNHMIRGSIEGVAHALSGGRFEKNTSVLYNPKLAAEAWADFKNVEKEALGERKYSDAGRQVENDIQDKRTVFKNNGTWGTAEAENPLLASAAMRGVRKAADVAMAGMEGYRKATNWTMEMGDQIFSRTAYADAMAGWMQAHKVKHISDMTPEMLDRARAFAIKEAQEATFRDSNGFSDWASRLGRSGNEKGFGKFIGLVGEGIMPFRKTPANVLMRAYEYSPLGVINTIAQSVQAVNGDATGSDVVNALSKTFTGTGLAFVGYLLARAGKLRTRDDDDKLEQFHKDQGTQDYALDIGGGNNITLDWQAPASIPLFMGAELEKIVRQGGISGDDALEILSQLTEPMLEMSMLSGLNDALELSNSYDNTIGALPNLILNSVLGYATQGLNNSLIRQAEQASEKVRRTSYTDPNSPLPSSVQRKISQFFGGIPGKDVQQQDYIDVWGRNQEQGSTGERVLQSFLNPAYVGRDRSTKYDGELERLYSAGYKSALPQKPARSTEVNGERLTPEEYETYATVAGQKKLELIGDFLNSEEYKTMSDEDREEVISNLYSYANHLAASDIAKERGEKMKESSHVKSMEKLRELDSKGGSSVDYLLSKTALASATDGKDYKAVDALLGDIDKMDKATQEQLFADVSRLDDRVEAHKAGIDTALWEAAYAKKKKLEEDKSTTAVQDVISMTQYLDGQKGLNRKQKDLLREQMGFYTTFRAEAEKFDKLTGAGLSADKAGKVWNAINALQPMEGHAGVTQNQRLKAISSMGNLSDAEKWAVLELYASESAYKKAMDAKAKGWTFDQWVQSYTKGK